MNTLAAILARTVARVERLKSERPIEELKGTAIYARQPRDFRAAFQAGGPRVIAEVKFCSPSKGRIYPGAPSGAEASRVASEYLASGAAAVSVLTEPDFFKGDADYLRRVREDHPEAALLMKDFIIDVYQLHLARWAGADAVLLIGAALARRLPVFLEDADALGLSALVEVHTAAELAAAREAGAELIGVNTRDLATLALDANVAHDLAPGPVAPPEPLFIAESGITTRAQLDELMSLGYRGFLVGGALMATGKPGKALKQLLSAIT